MANTGQFQKGHIPWHKGEKTGLIPWNKGRKLSNKEKEKLNMTGLELGHGLNKGKKVTPEQRKKNSESHKGQVAWNKGIKTGLVPKTAFKKGIALTKGKKWPQMSGANHYNWKGGESNPIIKLRTSAEYNAWRLKIFERDYFTCQMPGCGQIGRKIEAHHILKIQHNSDLILEVDNGITLCKMHHDKIRNKEKNFIELFTQIIMIKKELI